MQAASRHYYRAVVWHYVANDAQKAIDELYQALFIMPEHPAATALARQIGRPIPKNVAMPSRASLPSLRELDIANLLALLEQGEQDLFLLSFLSREEISDFVLRQIDWEEWLQSLGDFSKNTDRIWYCLLKHNHDVAFTLWQQDYREIRGAPVAYFQIAYMLQHRQDWAQAESYLRLLLEFGGVYREATMRMLLQLTQRKFASLAEIIPVHAMSGEEMLRMAYILQNSWDSHTLVKLLRSLPKSLHTVQQHLLFATLAASEGQPAPAMRALSQALAGKAYQELMDWLRHNTWTPAESHTRRLLHRFSKKLRGQELLPLATMLQESAPDWAGKLLHRAGQHMNDKGLIYLGKAICCFYMAVAAQASWRAYRSRKYFFQFCDLLSKADTNDPALKSSIMAWQGKLLYQEGQYSKCSEFLSQALAQFPASAELQETVRQLARNTCPVCASPRQETETCKECGYRPLSMFACEHGQLHWQGEQSSFPVAWALVTSDSLVYASDHPVHLIVWSPYAGEASILFCQNGTTVREKKATLRAGLNVWRENPFFCGMYEVAVIPPFGSANHHWFLVGKKGAGLAVQTQVNGREAERTLTVRCTDAWGFPLQKKTWLSSVAAGGESLSIEARREVFLAADTIAASWPLPEHPDLVNSLAWPRWLCLHSEGAAPMACVVAGYAHLAARDYITSILASWRARYARLPVFLEQNGERFFCKFATPQQQAIIATAPLGDHAATVIRRTPLDKGEALSVTLPAMFNAVYVGTTRFYPGHVCQEAGMELCGILANPSLTCSLEVEKRVAPASTFAVTIRANRPAQVVLFSWAAREALYFSLASHALRQMSAARGKPAQAGAASSADDQDAELPPAVPEKTKESQRQNDWQQVQVSGSARFLHMYEGWVENHVTLQLDARPDIGQQQLICVVSDGQFVAEEVASIAVEPPAYTELDVPAAILPGDYLKTKLTFAASQATRLQIRSWSAGVWYDKEVDGKGYVPLTIAGPDTIEVKLGDWEKRYELRPLTTQSLQHNMLHCLTAGMCWDCGPLTLYPDTVTLAEETVQALAHDTHPDSETLAACLYGAAKLYLHAIRCHDAARTLFWEKEIGEIAPRFCSATATFTGGRLGYWVSEPEDTRISAEVLHHLSPFANIPRFATLHLLVKKMMQTALAAGERNNRLFFLSMEFREHKWRSPEAAAAALLYGFDAEKALRFLQKTARYEKQQVYWQGISLGGVEETTAIVGRALYAHKFPLWQQAMAFLGGRFHGGTLSNPAATVAWLEWLWDMEALPGKLFSSAGAPLLLPQKTELTTSFSVVQGEIWGRHDRQIWEEVASDNIRGKLKIVWQGKPPLHVGDEFCLSLKLKGITYPSLRILVAANSVLLHADQVYQGDIIWPAPGRDIILHGKAIRAGMAHFYFILQDRYDHSRQVTGKHPVVVTD
jgi:tetratricopeptide (TPR) repeat protein